MSDKYITTRLVLTRKLENVLDSLKRLNQMTYQALSNTLMSLTVHNDYSTQLIENIYAEVYEQSIQTEQEAYNILTLQQPMIKDLRFIVGVIKIAYIYKNIVDTCLSISYINPDASKDQTGDIRELTNIFQNLLIIHEDMLNLLTVYSNSIFHETVTKITNNQTDLDIFNKQVLELSTDKQCLLNTLNIAKYIEYINNYTLTITRQIYFIHTGKRK